MYLFIIVSENVFIGLDKIGYQVNIFLISPQKHMLWVLICCGYLLEAPSRFLYENMLWVLIRSTDLDEALLMSTHNRCFCGEIRKNSQGACNDYPQHMLLWRNKKEISNTFRLRSISSRAMVQLWYLG